MNFFDYVTISVNSRVQPGRNKSYIHEIKYRKVNVDIGEMREHLIINELSEEFLLKEINRTPALPSQRFALLHTLHSAGNSFVHSVFHSHVILYEY